MFPTLYFLFLLGVGSGRLFEMRISRRHQAALTRQGARSVPERYFPFMVLLHMGVLAGSLIEVIALNRPFLPWLGLPALGAFLLSNLLRWWVIRTLAGHWNVRVMDSASLGIVSNGPYRIIRHPNYLAVFIEMLAIPLIHTAFITAVLGALAHLWVLWQRLRVEDAVLLANPDYQAVMGHKARFIPRLF